MKTAKIITALAAFGLALSAQAKDVVLHTNYGDITVALDEQNAPVSSQNFVHYAQKGFYNNTLFHRVIDGFMIQGGGFSAGMQQKTTDAPIKNEADNGFKNQRGTIAMARTSDPNSATSQFFINLKDNDFLDFKEKSAQGYGYAVFGRVTQGMDVVDKIAKVSTGSVGFYRDVPKADVIIQSVSVK